MALFSLLRRCPEPPRDSNRAAGPVLRHAALLAAVLVLGTSPTVSARPDPAALEAARRFLCPYGGQPVRGQGGRCRAATGNGTARGWDQGLPPPAYRQAPCPAGTHPGAALARPEAVRCLPD
ncbi:MAG: hypothetical protein ACOYOH_02370 [Paracraurococcus sp.]